MSALAKLLTHLDTQGRSHRGDEARAISMGFGGDPAASKAEAEQFEGWALALRALQVQAWTDAVAKNGSTLDVYLGAQCICMDVEGSDGPDEFCGECKGSGVPGGEE